MRLNNQLPALLAGTAIVSAAMIIQAQAAVALTGEEVNNIARDITVLIKGERGHGSGAIISKSGNTYHVLTAHHVVSSPDEYKIVTVDKQAHLIDPDSIKVLPGVDLAVVSFTSEEDYQIATLANSDGVSEGKPVFVSGWPRLTTVGNAAGGTLIRQFTDGRITGFLPQALEGYKLIYSNTTLAGMSGGPVLDAGGRLVGIHGLGDTEDATRLQQEGLTLEAARGIASLIKPGFNYAVPINAFLNLAPQSGLYLGLQVENSPSPELGAPYVASAQPDERDTITDIGSVLNTVNRGINTIRGIRGIFPF